MPDIQCADPLHSSRSGQPGWSATLGTYKGKAPNGLVCEACAKGRLMDSVWDDDNDNNQVLLAWDGTVYVQLARKYPSGEHIGFLQYEFKIGDVLNASQINQLKQLRDILKDYMKGLI
jgi:hypothetical protein